MCLDHRPKNKMADNNIVEGINTPVSDVTKQAIEQLKAEGATIAGDNTPNFEGEDIKDKEVPPKEEPAKIVKPPEKKDDESTGDEPKDPPPDEGKKPAREVKYTEAWRLKVAESQKEAVAKQLADAQAEIIRLSNKPSDLNNTEKKDLGDALKVIAEKHNVDPELLKDIRDSIIGQVTTPADVTEKLKKLDEIQAERDHTFQENEYFKEFDKDVLPLIKAENPGISEDALLQVKESLKQLAFTEEYGKLSLSKIFKAEKDSLNLPVASPGKKTTEGTKSGTIRISDTSYDELDEAGFLALSDEKKTDYMKYMATKNRK